MASDPLLEYESLPRCPITGKLSFKTKKIPPHFRKHHKRSPKAKPVHLESYKCPHCAYFHLTKNKPKHLTSVKRPPTDFTIGRKRKFKRNRP